MKTRILTKTEQEIFGANLLIHLTYEDVAALGASADNSASPLALFSVAAGDIVEFVCGKLKDATGFDFSDSGITSLTLKIGDGGNDDAYLVATQLAEDGTELDYFVETAITNRGVYTGADTVDAVFTSANGGSPLLSECTSGEVFLYFSVNNINRLPTA